MYGQNWLIVIWQALALLIVAPLVAGVIKKTKARLQNRRGPSLFQVYYDISKLLHKDSVVASAASWIFYRAPFIYFATAVGAAALVPVASSLFSLPGPLMDAFVLLYLLAAGRFFLVLASLDTASSFSGMGGSREMFITTFAEPAILLAITTVAFQANTTNLAAMTATAMSLPLGLASLFAAAAFYIVLITETGRIPVDNPDTHLELTMIHEGMIIEYSGKQLGLIIWASALKQLVLIAMFVALFLPNAADWTIIEQVLAFIGKMLLCAISLGVVETVTNKMRLFRVPGLLALSGLLSLLALIAQ
jgi:formate hydrogenlyase subunit 4